MNAAHIDDLAAQAWAGHHHPRTASRIAAQRLSRVRPDAALPFWCRPRIAVAVLALITCAAMAANETMHASDPAAMSPPGPMRPRIQPLLSDEGRLTAMQEGKRLRSMEPPVVLAPARPVPPVQSASAKTSATAIPPAAVSAPVPVLADGVSGYALATDITRTRIASELRQQLMGSSATVGELPGTPRTELMQVGAGWRAVVRPFATQNEADKARRMLAERGIRTELLKF